MHRIFALKRVLVQLRKIVSPQREVYNGLSRRDYPHIDPRATVYFRDVASSRTVRKAQKAERAARGIPGEGVLRRARYGVLDGAFGGEREGARAREVSASPSRSCTDSEGAWIA